MTTSQSQMIQHLSTTFGTTDVLLALQPLNFRVLTSEPSEAGDRTIVCLCPDGSIFLGIVSDDPEDDTREVWHTAGFGDLHSFEKFILGQIPEINDMLNLIEPSMRADLSEAVTKFSLCRSTEVGHA